MAMEAWSRLQALHPTARARPFSATQERGRAPRRARRARSCADDTKAPPRIPRMNLPTISAIEPTRTQRFRGVLLGGAVGDALGAAVEFMQRPEILSWFGAAGIRDFVAVDGRLGAITDDTQLTLFCAEALLRTHAQGVPRDDFEAHAQERSRSYLRWLTT